jgi:ATP-dependent RNA helicase RhlE
MPFSTLGLSSTLLKAIAEHGYTQPYPVQAETIPAILQGRDILGIAPTGSGKTAGYVLPVLMNLGNAPAVRNRNISILVMVPTRELAVQVRDVFKLFALALPKPPKVMAVYGGVSINPQMIGLRGVSILVATPGRLLELIESNALHLHELDTLILDEADKMLNPDFHEEMSSIIALLPKRRQNLLFSATLTDDVNTITQILLHDPLVIKIKQEEENPDLITQTAYRVDETKKGPLLRYLIRKNDLQQVLVFVSSVHQADLVTEKLRKNGIDATAIHSKKGQNSRTETLRRFKTGQIRVLVATDLISRGIDIQYLPCVINYELPRSPKDYIHRIGRTGRADSPGEAISFISPEEMHHFKVIQKKMGKWVEQIDSEGLDLNAQITP